MRGKELKKIVVEGKMNILERDEELCYQEFLIGRDSLTDYLFDFDGKDIRLTVEVVSKVKKNPTNKGDRR